MLNVQQHAGGTVFDVPEVESPRRFSSIQGRGPIVRLDPTPLGEHTSELVRE